MEGWKKGDIVFIRAERQKEAETRSRFKGGFVRGIIGRERRDNLLLGLSVISPDRGPFYDPANGSEKRGTASNEPTLLSGKR